MRIAVLLSALARAFLAGGQTVDGITTRSGLVLGRPWRWLRALSQRYLLVYPGGTRPRHREIVAFFEQDFGVQRAWLKYARELRVANWLTEPTEMRPVAAAESWEIPPFHGVLDLGDWAGLSLGELEWFADLRKRNYDRHVSAPLRHYRYRVLTKISGSLRLIEAPKPRLKELQQRILREILEKVPSHPATHGFVKGRSIRTFVTPHVGKAVVLRMDLRDFFPSIPRARIQALFRTMGYPEAVADRLGGICTSATPRDVWGKPGPEVDARHLAEVRALYAEPHLPQGAPSSPALANLCAYRVDCRLWGLAKTAGAQYTRYADDLAFSGGEDFDRRVDRFSTHVATILHEEGFHVHHRKTRVMRQGVRQHLAGLVANERVNVMRPDFDRLKATLTNCVQLGPASQNREAHVNFRMHLEGRVAFVESINRDKGKRLRAIFERIVWE